MSVFVTHYPCIASEITGGCCGHQLAPLNSILKRERLPLLNGQKENGLGEPVGCLFTSSEDDYGPKAGEFLGLD